MKIRQAPVADLLKYLTELYNSRPKELRIKNILTLVNRYYVSITNHKSIMPIANDFLNDWCDLNWSDSMKNCPNVPGIIVYKNKPDGSRFYGILYHSGYIGPQELQTNYLSYYHAHQEGHIGSHTYLAGDWDGWGAPVRYFKFDPENYVESGAWNLGERPLSLGCLGHDVRMLQTFLQKAHPNVVINGRFDENTLKALNETQSWCNLPQKNTFELNNEGQKIVEFLTNGNKN